MVDCSATPGRSCINGIGCAVCTPGAQQCKAGDPNTTQECAMDGSGWVDGQTCDMTNGEYCRGGRCVTRCGDLGSSYLGCEYWPTITTNSYLKSGFAFSIVIANPNTYDVNVRMEGGSLSSPRERIVRAGQVERIDTAFLAALSNNDTRSCTLDRSDPSDPKCLADRSAKVTAGAFRLTSNGPVAVYQFNPIEFSKAPGSLRYDDLSFTNDASLLMPQNVLGRQYIAVTAAAGGAFVSVVGVQAEGTNSVEIRTTASVFDPASPGRTLPAGTHTFSLERGEVLQLIESSGRGDLTGTLINSSGPVAAFSGNNCTQIPLGTPACDHLEEQLFPTTTWGRTYAVTPLRDRPTQVDHIIRIVAQRDGVTLSFNGIAPPAACNRMLNQGQFCEFQTRQPFQVTGSQPILVAQFMRGLGSSQTCAISGGIAPNRPDCVADPAMVLEVPTDQYRSNYNFLIPSTYQQNYINVTAPVGAMILLDGNMLMGTPTPVGANLVMYNVNVSPGAHNIRAMTDVERFGLKVYGVASYTSYAFPGGLDLAPISPPG